jgi:TrkA domain protein
MEVEEVKLPGVGLRRDFLCLSGQRVGVLSKKTGERQLIVYDERDPDSVLVSVDMGAEEASVLAELLGAPRVIERLARLREQVEGLATAGIPISPESPYVERPLGDAEIRTRTGVSVVAVARRDGVEVSPRPDFVFQAGDKVIVVGTDDGVKAVDAILNPS